jgi:hypothetical protein
MKIMYTTYFAKHNIKISRKFRCPTVPGVRHPEWPSGPRSGYSGWSPALSRTSSPRGSLRACALKNPPGDFNAGNESRRCITLKRTISEIEWDVEGILVRKTMLRYPSPKNGSSLHPTPANTGRTTNFSSYLLVFFFSVRDEIYHLSVFGGGGGGEGVHDWCELSV